MFLFNLGGYFKLLPMHLHVCGLLGCTASASQDHEATCIPDKWSLCDSTGRFMVNPSAEGPTSGLLAATWDRNAFQFHDAAGSKCEALHAGCRGGGGDLAAIEGTTPCLLLFGMHVNTCASFVQTARAVEQAVRTLHTDHRNFASGCTYRSAS